MKEGIGKFPCGCEFAYEGTAIISISPCSPYHWRELFWLFGTEVLFAWKRQPIADGTELEPQRG